MRVAKGAPEPFLGSVLHNINNNNVIIMVFNSFDILLRYYYESSRDSRLCEPEVLFVDLCFSANKFITQKI